MLTIRACSEEDWEALKAVRLAALADAPTAFGVSHAAAMNYTDAQWRERAAGRGQARFLLAYTNGGAVGLVGHVSNCAQECNLIAMWVAPAFRGTNAASTLVDWVKAHAVAAGHARLVLDVAPENGRAVTFYRKHGFSFLPEWEALESHPHIQVQKMEWLAAPLTITS